MPKGVVILHDCCIFGYLVCLCSKLLEFYRWYIILDTARMLLTSVH